MTTSQIARLNIENIKPEIGASVQADKAALLSGAHAAELRALLEQRGVLVFPKINFSDEEQITFTKTLGEYQPDKPDGSTTKISLDPETGANAEYAKASYFWHFDGYMNEAPILASILCAKMLSPTGGDTQFANTYAAYEALPDERKRQIEGLHALHAMAGAQMSVEPEPSYETFQKWRRVRSNKLPIVWTHRSGRKSLVVGNTALNVIGMDPLEGLDLLVYLRDWATQERFCYSHQWSAGDAVMWDNTGTLHRVTPYDAASGRLLHRTKLQGEEPLT